VPLLADAKSDAVNGMLVLNVTGAILPTAWFVSVNESAGKDPCGKAVVVTRSEVIAVPAAIVDLATTTLVVGTLEPVLRLTAKSTAAAAAAARTMPTSRNTRFCGLFG